MPNSVLKAIIIFMKAQYVWTILAVLCIVYGFLVFRTGSGTGFFLVWFGLAGIFLLFAFWSHIHFWSGLPAALKTVLIILAAAGLTFFIVIEAKIISAFSGEDEKGLDYLIVLGAQVYEDHPSTVLKYRLDKAAAYLKENEDTVCIVSGGQGYNEPFPEARGMRDYLIACGIPEERILIEDKSKTTAENFKFSRQFFDPANDRVGIVTNNFHMYRACRLAANAGIENAYAIPASSTLLYLPSNMLREFFAVVTQL